MFFYILDGLELQRFPHKPERFKWAEIGLTDAEPRDDRMPLFCVISPKVLRERRFKLGVKVKVKVDT